MKKGELKHRIMRVMAMHAQEVVGVASLMKELDLPTKAIQAALDMLTETAAEALIECVGEELLSNEKGVEQAIKEAIKS